MTVGQIRRTCAVGTCAVGLVVVVLAGCNDDRTPATQAAPSTKASTSAPAAGARDIDEAGATRIEARPFADWVTVTEQGTWVAGVDPGLVRYDGRTGEQSGQVALGEVCLAMDQGFGAIWAATCGAAPTMVRVDAATGKALATIALPGQPRPESSIGAGEGAVWALVSSPAKPGPELVVVDPARNAVARTVPAPPDAVAVRAGLGAVWVTSTDGKLHRLDPKTGEVQASTSVGAGASFLALGAGSVWVLAPDDGTVARVDPRTNAVTATIDVSPGAVGGGDITAADDAVWVRVSHVLAVKIDPATNTVVDEVGPSAGSGSIGLADDAVWITAHDTNSVWRLPTD